MNRFTILKTSWGIAVFYEIKEHINLEKDLIDIHKITPQVFLNMNNKIIDDVSFKYLKAGIESILPYIKNLPINFTVEKLEYNICDYQPEGMYYMFRKWFFENHNMETPPINVYYDKELNKYIFPDLANI
jgi:hypothetical protein